MKLFKCDHLNNQLDHDERLVPSCMTQQHFKVLGAIPKPIDHRMYIEAPLCTYEKLVKISLLIVNNLQDHISKLKTLKITIKAFCSTEFLET